MKMDKIRELDDFLKKVDEIGINIE